ncbi:neurotensin receptor type 1-like [Megalops cyprinoides]|uniref:neurotensin receptor type 1-like n=1 Tax=Megalops cyprinoides TaxID=118141 RepID=UPI0018651AC4|nr:neurotensin receptor type 1-like [Megalops cyprinoides]
MGSNDTLLVARKNLFDFGVLAQQLLSPWNHSQSPADNHTEPELEDNLDVNTDIYSKVLVTVIYIALFVVGCLGNCVTLYTLLRKKSLQNLQSTVHYHLVSLAVSDLLILVLCMPIELYNFIWVHHPWAFGGAVCKGYYFLRDGCSYATAFNIASLSVERYMAICHPFKAKSIMSRSRTKKLISAIWVASFLLATPMLMTMGLQHVGEEKICTTTATIVTAKTVLQVNALLSFAVPMALVTALNSIISRQLLRMFLQAAQDCRICVVGGDPAEMSVAMETNRVRSLRHGVKVLRAVVLAFVVCWLPYHARRLMYCYVTEWTDSLYDFYHYFYMVTNVLFYVSSAINPVLYNLVSANYRQIFFSTLHCFCLPCCRTSAEHKRRQQQQCHPMAGPCNSTNSHTLSTNIVRETVY